MSDAGAQHWLSKVQAMLGREALPPQTAVDPVNLPMIRRWCEAMGERNPLHLEGDVAPPAMLFVWTMSHFRPDLSREGGSLLGLDLVDAAGFTSVVATNIEEEYCRDLRCGDVITQRVTLDAISGEKKTGLGVGHFVTFRYECHDQKGELVGRTLFRILKFRARAKQLPHPRPAITRDSAFFWEGLNQRKLLVRKCGECERLHHPPGPMCPECQSLEWTALQCSGRGKIHSFVVVHQPQIPGFKYPLPVALVDLEEGVRVVANLLDIQPGEVRIDMPVEVQFVEVEKDFVIPAFRERRVG
ncbi:MAG: bifunctional MaoC family dehydratase N-terminal/OB-fold nucleic acid binding domain-containing protein [Steroidobacteraceae bacterium]|nr:bifunctional MaoC family dehydratase/OB-fold nucleic acid binding domain-containing protein [Steroidobacteraceae bacterium]MBP7012550.1 bifunctional MaoC family dehydratase/OB-fold nucleic acid binding domain-containing protein [Steroidobacteraceae bacterium]